MASTIKNFTAPLPPGQLDDFLARGWRSTGQSVYNSSFLYLESQGMVGVLPTRLELRGTRFGKKSRRILRRGLDRFRTEYGPARPPDTDKERVNERYMENNGEKSLTNLDYHLYNTEGHTVLNTHETRVYDGDKLVAFSYFDLGERAAYSKAGIYDPAYASSSLGLFTLLFEVQLCRERGLDYFYPGYVAPESPVFNYKHRIGPLEFFAGRRATTPWLPYTDFAADQHDPLAICLRKLSAIRQVLNLRGFAIALYSYPYNSACFSRPGAYLDTAVLLYLGQLSPERHRIVYFDTDSGRYRDIVVREAGLFIAERQGTDRISGLPNFMQVLSLTRQAPLFDSEAVDLVLANLLGSGLQG